MMTDTTKQEFIKIVSTAIDASNACGRTSEQTAEKIIQYLENAGLKIVRENNATRK